MQAAVGPVAALPQADNGRKDVCRRVAVGEDARDQLADLAHVGRRESAAHQLLRAEAQRRDRPALGADPSGGDVDPCTLEPADGPVGADRVRQGDREMVGLGEPTVGAGDEEAGVGEYLT